MTPQAAIAARAQVVTTSTRASAAPTHFTTVRAAHRLAREVLRPQRHGRTSDGQEGQGDKEQGAHSTGSQKFAESCVSTTTTNAQHDGSGTSQIEKEVRVAKWAAD